jgi:UDP-glucose 4-epimerase
MKCIVTGGCGFLGSHLVEKLVIDGHNITVIDNLVSGKKKNIQNVKDKITFVYCDINNKKKIKKYFKNVDWVFHLAALADIVPSIQKPVEYFKSNVEGTLNILELSKSSNKLKKFIYIASSSSYGIPKRYPTSEKNQIDPQYPYALTKYMGEELVMHWGKVYNLPVISLRCFNIYGTRSRTSGAYGAVMGVFLAQKINKKPLTIVGNGNQRRDFTFVTDVIEAIYFLVKSKIINEVFNIGSGKTISINYLVKLLGKNKKTYLPKRPGEPFITYADISKIKKLGWKPKIDIKTGISILLKNINDWSNAPVWSKKKIKQATNDWFKFLRKSI